MSKLADNAVKAVTSPKGYEKGKSMCQRFVRQNVQEVHGDKYNAFMKASAKLSGEAFLRDGRFVVPKERGSVPGDILYILDGSGGFGHVGIRVAGNRVAENSVVHFNASGGKDGRGFRDLDDFGLDRVDVIVRLPED